MNKIEALLHLYEYKWVHRWKQCDFTVQGKKNGTI